MTVEATIEMNSQPVSPEDQFRADLYSLLGSLLLEVPNQTTLDQLSQLQGDDGDVGSAVNALAQIAKSMNPAAVEREVAGGITVEQGSVADVNVPLSIVPAS